MTVMVKSQFSLVFFLRFFIKRGMGIFYETSKDVLCALAQKSFFWMCNLMVIKREAFVE